MKRVVLAVLVLGACFWLINYFTWFFTSEFSFDLTEYIVTWAVVAGLVVLALRYNFRAKK